MTIRLTDILHDLKRIAEAQKELNKALDKVCSDVLTHVNGGGNDKETDERKVYPNDNSGIGICLRHLHQDT